VIEQVREALKELDYASEPYVNEIARTALAALDAALAEPEPEPEPVVVEQLFAPALRRAAASDQWMLDRVADDGRSGIFRLVRSCAAPEPDAKREPATEKQVTEAYMAKGPENWWSDYQAGWRAAERFHGIRKEDK
jgi:hypothetical protein